MKDWSHLRTRPECPALAVNAAFAAHCMKRHITMDQCKAIAAGKRQGRDRGQK
jgi:hypothetical protein